MHGDSYHTKTILSPGEDDIHIRHRVGDGGIRESIRTGGSHTPQMREVAMVRDGTPEPMHQMSYDKQWGPPSRVALFAMESQS
jgi:hypothetical protein